VWDEAHCRIRFDGRARTILGLSGRAPAAAQPAGQEALAIVVTAPIRSTTCRSPTCARRSWAVSSGWPNGRKITVLMRPAGDVDRAVVLRLVCRMIEAEFQSKSWQATFTGEATAARACWIGPWRPPFRVQRSRRNRLHASQRSRRQVIVIHARVWRRTDPGYRLTVARPPGSVSASGD